MDNPLAVSVKKLDKQFKLPLERQTTLKSTFINLRRARQFKMQDALKNINFEVKKGEFYGIIGRNGSGKSTLLKLLAGIYYPTAGEIKINGALTPFIELGVGFNPELTGRENVYLNGALLGFSRKEMRAMYKDIVDFAEIEQFMDQKLKNYSSGMQVRLAFSIAIRARSDILLIDEVLAVGDLLFQQKCYDTFKDIKRQGRTVVFVSHDLGAIETFCDRTMLINKGKMITIGDPREVIAQYKSMMAEEEKARGGGKANHIVRSGKLNIVSGEILVEGKSVKSVPEGKPFTIRVHFKAKDIYKSPSFGVGIIDEHGNSLIGPNTREAGYKIDEVKGRGYLDAYISNNVLAPGVYSIRAASSNEVGLSPEDYVENLTLLKITGKSRYGQIYIEPEWTIGKE